MCHFNFLPSSSTPPTYGGWMRASEWEKDEKKFPTLLRMNFHTGWIDGLLGLAWSGLVWPGLDAMQGNWENYKSFLCTYALPFDTELT